MAVGTAEMISQFKSFEIVTDGAVGVPLGAGGTTPRRADGRWTLH